MQDRRFTRTSQYESGKWDRLRYSLNVSAVDQALLLVVANATRTDSAKRNSPSSECPLGRPENHSPGIWGDAFYYSTFTGTSSFHACSHSLQRYVVSISSGFPSATIFFRPRNR